MQGIYYFELAALPVYLVLFIATIYRRMTRGRTNILFLAVVGSSFIAVIADLFGWINDNAFLSSKIGFGVVVFSVYLYFVMRNGINVAYLFFIFSVTRTWHRLRGFWKKALIIAPYALILGMLTTNETTHAVFSVTRESGYARGEYIIVLYICAAFYMIFGMIYLALNRRVLDGGERIALYMMYVLNAIAIVIQLFFPAILLECFMTAITLLFIVLFVQRPEKQVDMNTKLPAFWAFGEEIDKIAATGQKVQAVIVGIRNAADIRNHIGDADYYDYIHMISDAVDDCAKENRIRHELYYEFPGFFYIMLENMDYSPAQACAEIKNSIRERKGAVKSAGIRADVAIAVVAFPDEIGQKDELLWFSHNFIRFARPGKVYSHASQITEQREYRIETRIHEILERAIRDKRLEIRYEPIRTCENGKAEYAEAVLCLHDEQFGDIDNDTLYKAVGARGLTGVLEGYVTEQVFSYVASEVFTGSGYECIVLRLSAAYGGQADYPDLLWNLRGKYNIHPEQICFAVDEPDSSDMEGSLGDNLKKLSLLGYRFRYDGYGMGHYDLQNITRLPFTAVKLDRRMVKEAESPEGRSILEGSIHLLKRLSLLVVAQDEDDQETADMLCMMGCDYLLGKTIINKEALMTPRVRILIVDDESINRKVFISMLQGMDVTITEAAGGREAVDLAGKQKFDLIFMDHLMPDMDGVETLMKIREKKDGPCYDTPVIVLTANLMPEAKEKFMEVGFDGFLPKPVMPDILKETIRKQLSGSPSTENFPVIPGLDWNVALMRLKDKKILDSVLSDFTAVIDRQADELQKFKDGLPETFHDYRILVHGMKSASASVGLLNLSGMAAMLEKASGEKDEDTVERLHAPFLKEWRGYKSSLKEYLHAEEESSGDKEMISDEILGMLLEMLSKAMEEMDIDAADDAVEKLSSYRLPGRAAEKFDELRAAVSSLDPDTAIRIVEEINGL